MLFWGSRRSLELAAVALLCLLAAGARFYRLDAIPPGFHHDEAFEAVEALKVLAGGYPPLFFPGNFGVEPLFIYLTALAFKLFGASPTVMRGVAALLGSLTVPALYWLGKELERATPRLPHGLGLAAGAVLAGLYWHISFSRVGIEPVLVPLVAILMAASLWRGLRTRRPLWFALSGVCAGLGPYTYPAGRLLPFLLLVFVPYSWLVERSLWRGQGRHLAVLGAAAALVFLPLGITWARAPALLTLRTQQVAVTAEGRGGEQAGASLLRNARDTALGISVAGDSDPRSNLPGRPMLDPLQSILFYLGLLLALALWRRPAAGFVLLWLGIMLAPTILSEYAPHFRRALGAAPAVALLAGLGAAALVRWAAPADHEWPHECTNDRHSGAIRVFVAPIRGRQETANDTDIAKHIAVVAVLVLLLAGYSVSSFWMAWDYFVRWGHSAQLFYAFDVGLADVAQRIAAEPADSRVYLSPRPADHPTLAFFLWGKPMPRRFDGRAGIVLPPEGEPATYWIISHEDWRSAALLERYLPDARPAERILDGQGEVYAQAYRQPAAGRLAAEPPLPYAAQFGAGIDLLGWQPVNPTLKPGDVLYVDCYWLARQTVATDYTAFVHLLGEYNPATAGPLWAGADRQPCAGACATSTWMPGERIIDQVQVQLPADLPAGTYQVEAGWYDLKTMQRLPAREAGGVLGDRVVLGRVTIQSEQ